jgi:WD40 repeat protein
MATGRFSADNNVAKVWSTENWQVTHTISHLGKFLTISPDGKSLAVVSHVDARLWLYHTETGNSKGTQITGVWGPHLRTNAVICAVYSPNEKLLATTAIETNIKLWDAATLKSLGELKGIDSPPSCVRFSPDSKLVAATSWKGDARVWDVQTRERVLSFRTGDSGWSAAFSPDGTLLATGHSNGTVTLLVVATGEKCRELRPKDVSFGKCRAARNYAVCKNTAARSPTLRFFLIARP